MEEDGRREEEGGRRGRTMEKVEARMMGRWDDWEVEVERGFRLGGGVGVGVGVAYLAPGHFGERECSDANCCKG
jgi:hypothetical protein